MGRTPSLSRYSGRVARSARRPRLHEIVKTGLAGRNPARRPIISCRPLARTRVPARESTQYATLTREAYLKGMDSPALLERLPHALRRRRHVDMADAVRAPQRVHDGVHHGRARSDGA